VWGWPGLTIDLAMAALHNFLRRAISVLCPAARRQLLSDGRAGVGLLGGGLLLSTWGGFHGRVAMMFAALALEGRGMILLGVAPANAFSLALIGNLLWGFARPIIDGLIFAILQAIVPPEMLGRVFSLILSACALMTPLGLLVAGPVVDALGVQFWYALTGVLTLCASALGFSIPAVRQLEQRKIASLVAESLV
jgi:DHA3 family macrolide efflux protein-like MFS transporter